MLAKLIIITCFLINPLDIFEYLPPVYKTYRFPSKSMHPTIQSGEYILVNLQAYISSKPQKGDLIVFKYPEDPSIHYVKRVVALAGETVELKQDKLFVNNKPVAEDYVFFDKTIPFDKQDFGPLKVSSNTLFVLGDNRYKSGDSRFFGSIPLENIIGQVVLVIWSDDPTRRWKKVD